jgi:hypothetical protein
MGSVLTILSMPIELKGSRKTNQKILIQMKGMPVIGEIMDDLFLHLVLAFRC